MTVSFLAVIVTVGTKHVVFVEARNSVLDIWAPPIRADGASGATGYKGSLNPVAGLFLEKGKARKGEEVK